MDNPLGPAKPKAGRYTVTIGIEGQREIPLVVFAYSSVEARARVVEQAKGAELWAEGFAVIRVVRATSNPDTFRPRKRRW